MAWPRMNNKFFYLQMEVCPDIMCMGDGFLYSGGDSPTLHKQWVDRILDYSTVMEYPANRCSPPCIQKCLAYPWPTGGAIPCLSEVQRLFLGSRKSHCTVFLNLFAICPGALQIQRRGMTVLLERLFRQLVPVLAPKNKGQVCVFWLLTT